MTSVPAPAATSGPERAEARYALYYAPPTGSALAAFGEAWLQTPQLDGFDPGLLRALTKSPRKYGFHGTLKPPFRLAAGCDVASLEAAVSDFTARRAPFSLGPLKVCLIDGFLALVPGNPSESVAQLAADCVTHFDPFRRHANRDEMARRRAAGLDAVEESYLQSWGYPYVLDRFRFHLTLTERLVGRVDADRLPLLQKAITERFAAACREEPPLVADLCLFTQPTTNAPFTLAKRFSFSAT
ncbi:MAG: DUF1045 domain-containing protein [Magnetospiraceae bacterium]